MPTPFPSCRNHEVLPHWTPEVNKNFPNGSRYSPPEMLHSPYYPKLGPYSSRDPEVLDTHMDDMKRAGIDVAALVGLSPRSSATICSRTSLPAVGAKLPPSSACGWYMAISLYRISRSACLVSVFSVSQQKSSFVITGGGTAT